MQEYYLTRPIDDYYYRSDLDYSPIISRKESRCLDNSNKDSLFFKNFLNFQTSKNSELDTNIDSDSNESNKSFLDSISALEIQEGQGCKDIVFLSNKLKVSQSLKGDWKKCIEIYRKFSLNSYKNILNEQAKKTAPFIMYENLAKNFGFIKSEGELKEIIKCDKNNIQKQIDFEQFSKYYAPQSLINSNKIAQLQCNKTPYPKKSFQ